MDNKQTIDYVLRKTWNTVMKMYNEEASKYGATMVLGYTLLSIDPKNGTPSTTLGPKMGIESTSISRTIKSLEKRNLITRKPHETDRRSVIIELTEEGLQKRDETKRIVKLFNDTIRENVSQEKLDNFYEVVETINKLVTENKIYT